MKTKTMWEVKTNGYVERTQVEREVEKYRQEAKTQLNDRRRELAMLYDKEDQK